MSTDEIEIVREFRRRALRLVWFYSFGCVALLAAAWQHLTLGDPLLAAAIYAMSGCMGYVAWTWFKLRRGFKQFDHTDATSPVTREIA